MAYYGNGGPGIWLGFLMLIIMMAFLAFIIIGVVFIFRRALRHDGNSLGYGEKSGSSSALAILDERFARGDIDIEESILTSKNIVSAKRR